MLSERGRVKMNKKLATWQTSRVSRWGTRQSKEFLSWSRQQKQPFFSDSRTNVSKLGNFVVSHVCLPVIFRFYGAVKALIEVEAGKVLRQLIAFRISTLL